MNRRAFIQESLSRQETRIVSLARIPLEYRELIRPARRVRLGDGYAYTEAHTEARRKRRRTEKWQPSSAAEAAESATIFCIKENHPDQRACLRGAVCRSL